jgi:FKBP12-rapamycin complex-associated protein
MLASAVGPNLTKLLHDQLDLFFACGLSEPLRQALVAIARNIPPLLKTIQGALVDVRVAFLRTHRQIVYWIYSQ